MLEEKDFEKEYINVGFECARINPSDVFLNLHDTNREERAAPKVLRNLLEEYKLKASQRKIDGQDMLMTYNGHGNIYNNVFIVPNDIEICFFSTVFVPLEHSPPFGCYHNPTLNIKSRNVYQNFTNRYNVNIIDKPYKNVELVQKFVTRMNQLKYMMMIFKNIQNKLNSEKYISFPAHSLCPDLAFSTRDMKFYEDTLNLGYLIPITNRKPKMEYTVYPITDTTSTNFLGSLVKKISKYKFDIYKNEKGEHIHTPKTKLFVYACGNLHYLYIHDQFINPRYLLSSCFDLLPRKINYHDNEDIRRSSLVINMDPFVINTKDINSIVYRWRLKEIQTEAEQNNFINAKHSLHNLKDLFKIEELFNSIDFNYFSRFWRKLCHHAKIKTTTGNMSEELKETFFKAQELERIRILETKNIIESGILHKAFVGLNDKSIDDETRKKRKQGFSYLYNILLGHLDLLFNIQDEVYIQLYNLNHQTPGNSDIRDDRVFNYVLSQDVIEISPERRLHKVYVDDSFEELLETYSESEQEKISKSLHGILICDLWYLDKIAKLNFNRKTKINEEPPFYNFMLHILYICELYEEGSNGLNFMVKNHQGKSELENDIYSVFYNYGALNYLTQEGNPLREIFSEYTSILTAPPEVAEPPRIRRDIENKLEDDVLTRPRPYLYHETYYLDLVPCIILFFYTHFHYNYNNNDSNTIGERDFLYFSWNEALHTLETMDDLSKTEVFDIRNYYEDNEDNARSTNKFHDDDFTDARRLYHFLKQITYSMGSLFQNIDVYF